MSFVKTYDIIKTFKERDDIVNRQNETVHFMDLVSMKDMKGEVLASVPDIRALHMYRLIGPGVLQLSSGTVFKMRRNNDLYFDVTPLPRSFHETHASCIKEMVIRKIIGRREKQSKNIAGQIIYLVAVDDAYAQLSPSVLKELGRHYVLVRNTENGIAVDNSGVSRGRLDGLHILVEPEFWSEETKEAVEPLLIELVRKENDFYSKCDSVMEKKMDLHPIDK